MGGSGGGGTASSTTTTGPSGFVRPYAGAFLNSVYGNVNQDLTNGPPPGLFSQVAPFSGFQNQGLNMLGGLGGLYGPYGTTAGGYAQGITPLAQNLSNLGANTVGGFASGGLNAANNPTLSAFANGNFTGPNPFLNSYYNQAAQQLTNQFQLGTEPALMAQFQQAGAFNSPGFNQAQALAQNQYGNSLATLGANIYEPAYQQGMANMLSAGNSLQQNAQFNAGNRLAAAQGLPAAVAGLYGPSNNLLNFGQGLAGFGGQLGSTMYGAGQAQQQQAQNVLNANQSNAAQTVNWPFAILSQLGGALGQANMGAGQTVAQGPSSSGGK